MKVIYRVLVLFLFVILSACATFKSQYKGDRIVKEDLSSKKIKHSFYLIGDAGKNAIGDTTIALKQFSKALSKASENSTALFLGDNIYQKGMPSKKDPTRPYAEHQLNVQIAAAKAFSGRSIFIPGNHDWYSNGLKGLKREENYIEDRLGKNSFLPEDGCPLKKVEITDDITLIVVDSQWYLTNWNNHPTINDDCEIKTRTVFFEELEGMIKKARGKTTLIALHHPMYTNGPHGGRYGVRQHVSPVPVLGSLLSFVRKTSGISNADTQNKRYLELKKRIVTLSKENAKVIFVSGHEHSLQYLEEDNVPQIISGAGAKKTVTKNKGGGLFSYGAMGYSRLDVFEDGAVVVQFYEAKDNRLVYQKEIFSAENKGEEQVYETRFPEYKKASIYTADEIKKGRFYTYLWGDRYRKYYGVKIKSKTVVLDTLFGGLTPVRKGGGHQSKSLRLKAKDGREYVMRAIRKNAIQYIQAVAFKEEFIEEQFNGTYTEDLILDVFSGSYPYAPFVVGDLADAIGLFHSNPTLYYIPKHKALQGFNDEFGDELYMIEERAASGHGDQASFGFSNKIVSTADMLKKIRKNEHHVVDEEAYVKARLFDMLIGDWDRHEDQWRWAIFNEGKKIVYRPVPRDRDQAFSIMDDGALLGIGTALIPGLRLLRSYEETLKKPKWFNVEQHALDMALINRTGKEVWDNQVAYIQRQITDSVIDTAFLNVPEEVKGETIDEIKVKLRGRRKNLKEISDKYFAYINKTAIIKGTDKADWFAIERLPEGKTKVVVYRIKKGKKGKVIHEGVFDKDVTKEIWLYGLDDDDVFKVYGSGNRRIKLRIIGGQNKDTYIIENGKRVSMYDYRFKKSVFKTKKGRRRLTNDYETNIYDHKRPKDNLNQLIPVLGFNPDDGFKIGIKETYTSYGFERNPFTSQHKFSGAYFFATNGFEFSYLGTFANVVGDWNLGINAIFTSPNYSINFFGFGNETVNLNVDEDQDLDYNRMRISKLKFEPFLKWTGEGGGSFKVSVNYESVNVENTEGRFIVPYALSNELKDTGDFYGSDAEYLFKNVNNEAFPSLGMTANLKVGYKRNAGDGKGFGYVIPSIGFNYQLEPKGQLVLATKLHGHLTLGNNFEFYHAASLGADNGLRSFRKQRFTGKNFFYQSSDLRLNVGKVKTGWMPLSIGLYSGFDYGRVWWKGDSVDKWHSSYGGGVFLTAANMITGNLSLFTGDEGARFALTLGFGF